MAVASASANDKLCFQAKLHKVVHYLSPYWPLLLHPPSSLVLSLTFLFNYLMSPLLDPDANRDVSSTVCTEPSVYI